MAVLPQGRTKLLFLTGNPISEDETSPLNFFPTVTPKRYSITDGERPVVYELSIKKSGLSLKISVQVETSS